MPLAPLRPDPILSAEDEFEERIAALLRKDPQWARALREMRRKLAADSWTVNPALARANDDRGWEYIEGFEEDWTLDIERGRE